MIVLVLVGLAGLDGAVGLEWAFLVVCACGVRVTYEYIHGFGHLVVGFEVARGEFGGVCRGRARLLVL